MATTIRPILENESSPNVVSLHAALQQLGFSVDPKEVAEQRAGESTTKFVRQLQAQLNLKPKPGYVVDEATAAALNQLIQARNILQTGAEASYLAYGTVTGSDGQPVRAVPLKLFDQDLRSRQELGQTTTGADGKYRIPYSAKQFRQAELGGPDLVLEAYDPSGAVLKTSNVFF